MKRKEIGVFLIVLSLSGVAIAEETSPSPSPSTPPAETEQSENVFEAKKIDPQKAQEEPNFVVIDGRVVPNPKKMEGGNVPAGTGSPSVQTEEPNFIVMNGQVVRNPNKRVAS